MARVLIVGCGCRGQALTRALVTDGHPVRGTTRSRERFADIERAGAEPYLGDPDRIVTLMDALAAVTAVVWLLGEADAPDLHAGRLRMLCEKIVDTPVRGLVYEASERFPEGREIVADAAQRWLIPTATVRPKMDTGGILAALDSLQILQSR